MLDKWSVRGGLVVILGVVLCFTAGAKADVLLSLATDDVATTYTYPDGGDPGLLVLDDSNLGAIATFSDVPQLSITDVELSLAVELIGELGIPGDQFAHGDFGGGVMTLTDLSGGSPGDIIFQAQVTDFELMETQPGSFIGSGSFTGASYGGVLSGIIAPADGQLLTSLFSWRELDSSGPLVDIDTFVTSPGVPTVFADMHDLNILPEPGTIVMLTVLSCGLMRRRQSARVR